MDTRTLKFVSMTLLVVSACAADGVTNRSSETAKVIETESSESLRMQVRSMFDRGATIHIRFAPFESMGRSSFGRDYIATHWRFAAFLRCGTSCEDAAPKLYIALTAARRVEPACPPRFAAMITLEDLNGIETGVVYVHESRNCVVINDTSYFLPNDALSEILEGIDRLRW
jgi:hypothetical protein